MPCDMCYQTTQATAFLIRKLEFFLDTQSAHCASCPGQGRRLCLCLDMEIWIDQPYVTMWNYFLYHQRAICKACGVKKHSESKCPITFWNSKKGKVTIFFSFSCQLSSTLIIQSIFFSLKETIFGNHEVTPF